MMWRFLLAPLLILLLITLPPSIAEEADSDTVAEAAEEITTEGQAATGNSTEAKGENTFADMIDRALQKEFTETEQTGAETDPGSFNNSVAENEAVLETVARVTTKKNETKDEQYSSN